MQIMLLAFGINDKNVDEKHRMEADNLVADNGLNIRRRRRSLMNYLHRLFSSDRT